MSIHFAPAEELQADLSLDYRPPNPLVGTSLHTDEAHLVVV